MPIPNSNPANRVGSAVVNSSGVSIVTITADITLSPNAVDANTGAETVIVTNTTGALNVNLPYAVTGAGALTYLPLAGQTRTILNSASSNQNITVRSVATINATTFLPATFVAGVGRTSTLIPFAANLAGALDGIVGATYVCDGTGWFLASQTLIPAAA